MEEESWKKMEGEGAGIRHIVPLTTDPSPTISFTDPALDWLDKTTPLEARGSEVRGGGAMTATQNMKEAQQVRGHVEDPTTGQTTR